MEVANSLMAVLNVFMAALMVATAGRCYTRRDQSIAWALAVLNIAAAAINIAAVLT